MVLIPSVCYWHQFFLLSILYNADMDSMHQRSWCEWGSIEEDDHENQMGKMRKHHWVKEHEEKDEEKPSSFLKSHNKTKKWRKWVSIREDNHGNQTREDEKALSVKKTWGERKRNAIIMTKAQKCVKSTDTPFLALIPIFTESHSLALIPMFT